MSTNYARPPMRPIPMTRYRTDEDLVCHVAAIAAALADGKDHLINENDWNLIRNPKALNTRMNNGETALIFSSKRNDTKTTLKLIELNADVNLEDKNGRSALYWAHNHENAVIYRALKQAMQKPTHANNQPVKDFIPTNVAEAVCVRS